MLQSPGVKQPHDPGDWASYLLARRRCTSPAPPREPDRAGGTLRPPHIERRAASRALRPRRLALRTRGDRAREPGGGKISASRPGAAIERSRPRSIFFWRRQISRHGDVPRTHTRCGNSAVPSRPPKTGMADDQSSCVHDAEGVGLSVLELYSYHGYSALSGCDGILDGRL
jgi:hypothetical protein